MTDNKDLNHQPVGRPRSESSKMSILNATTDLIEDSGYSNLTIEGIAAHAGVGKSTIYRWWNSKAFIILDAFLMSTETNLNFLESASISENFRHQLQNLAEVFNSALGRTVIALVAENGEDSELSKAFYTYFLEPRRQDAKRVLEYAMKQGEIKPSINLDVTSDLLYGPVYFRVLIYKKQIDGSFIDTLIEHVMSGIGAS